MKTVIVSVSEAALLFGIWKDRQEGLKDKAIVVLNRRNHRVVGAFKLIPVPIPLEERCPCCLGKGKVDIKYGLEGRK